MQELQMMSNSIRASWLSLSCFENKNKKIFSKILKTMRDEVVFHSSLYCV